jgi:hypothetical protein
MEFYSFPNSPEFDATLAAARHLSIIDCIALAAQCGVVYNPVLAPHLTHYDILETVWVEGDFTLFRQLLNNR